MFHIPQAQRYCDGKWHEWDDKITTPPGLYAVTVAYHRLTQQAKCTVSSLRAFNGCALFFAAGLALFSRQQSEGRLPWRRAELPLPLSLYSRLTAFNVALFPVLFFFSELYYTDVLSTTAVLLCYTWCQSRTAGLSGRRKPSVFSDLVTVVLGVAALAMRQTNVFWVVVYMGGMEAVHVVRNLGPQPVEKPGFKTLVGMVKFYGWRYSVGDVHDPPLSIAWPHGELLSSVVANPDHRH